MEPTYKIIGGDGKEYGPVSLNQLKTWIGEGRIDGEIQVMRSDQSNWGPAASLPELGLGASPDTPPSAKAPSPLAAASPSAPAPHPPAAAPAGPSVDQLRLANTARSGAGWFYWIAGLSVINSIATLSGSSWGFIIGLGITQVFDALASNLGGSGKLVALVLDLLAAGVLVVFGVFANKGRAWAFVVGMILYALDGLIFLVVGDWLSVGFHVFALFCILAGFSANQKLRALQRAQD
jgi:hypothetical protein